MTTLDDLPRLLPRPALLSVHGLGRGGGEVVATKIRAIYAAAGWDLPVLASTAGHPTTSTPDERADPADGAALLTAGPRDLPRMARCLRRGQPFDVYVQVPYRRATTWRDPLHALAVWAWLLAVTLFARRVLANSAATAASLPVRRATVVWPVTRAELASTAGRATPGDPAGGDPSAGTVIDVVCRLARERGRGSRDLEALSRLLAECRRRRADAQAPIRVRHFGDCDDGLRRQLAAIGGEVLSFEGHRTDWLRAGRGPVVLLSRYDGFGLAAFEAAGAGRPVFVNEAFPDDLLHARPAIRRIRSAGGRAILPQLFPSPR